MGRDLRDGPQGPGGERSTETGLRGARAAALGKDIAAEGRPPRWGPGLARPQPPPPPPARPRICSRQTRRCPPDGSARTACSGPWRGLGARSAGSALGPTSALPSSAPAQARGREAAARRLLHLLRAQTPPPAHFRATPEPEKPVGGRGGAWGSGWKHWRIRLIINQTARSPSLLLGELHFCDLRSGHSVAAQTEHRGHHNCARLPS